MSGFLGRWPYGRTRTGSREERRGRSSVRHEDWGMNNGGKGGMDGTRRPVSAAVVRKRPGTGLWPLDGAARAAFRPLEPGDGPTKGFPGPFPEPDRRAALCRRRGEGTTRRVLAVSRRQLLAGDYHRTAAGVDRTPPTHSAALPAVPSRWPRQCGRFSRAIAEHRPIGVREAIVARAPPGMKPASTSHSSRI